MADVAQVVLDISLDGITAPISKVARRTFGQLLQSASRTFDFTINWF